MDLTNNTSVSESPATRPAWMPYSFNVGGGLIRLMTILVYLFLYTPIAIIVLMSFYPGMYMTFPLPGFSLQWYREFFQDELLIRASLNSVVLGAATAILGALIGTPCAIGLVRFDFPGKRFFNTFVLAPMIIPGIITGISLLVLLNSLNLPRGYLYLLIGHVVLTVPYIVITVSSQLYGFPRELEEAALSLGANEIQTFFEITLPLIAPSVFAGMLFAFTVSFQEFVASQAWASPSSYTLPLRIFGRIRDALTPEINVIGVLMVILSLGVATAFQIISQRRQGGGLYGV